eukprot:1881372-Ditylum_brightwellii.AAC.1
MDSSETSLPSLLSSPALLKLAPKNEKEILFCGVCGGEWCGKLGILLLDVTFRDCRSVTLNGLAFTLSDVCLLLAFNALRSAPMPWGEK